MANKVEGWLVEAGRWYSAGRLMEAKAVYMRVLSAEPSNGQALHGLSLIAYQGGHNDEAIKLVQLALKHEPGRASFHNTLGSALLANGQLREAAVAYQRAIVFDPQSVEAKNNLANAFQAQGKLDEAVSAYLEALIIAPNNADLHLNLGNALHRKGDVDGAIEHFRRSLEIAPNDGLAYTGLGNALCDKREFDAAIAAYQRAIALEPLLAIAYNNLGNALCVAGRVDAAVEAYKSGLVVAPDNAELQKNLGKTLRNAGRWDEAEVPFAAALALDPHDTELEDLQHSNLVIGRMSKAASDCLAAIRARPKPEYLSSLGEVLNSHGWIANGLDAIAQGPGIVSLSLESLAGKEPSPRVERLEVGVDAPSFIGCWQLPQAHVCKSMIEFFEKHAVRHQAGRTGLGVDHSIKHSTDLPIYPNELHAEDHWPIKSYIQHLELCLQDYALQWPHLKDVTPKVDMTPFNIQRYGPGQHFSRIHSERMAFGYAHRVLAWMTYLNDVEAGGETVFPHFDLSVRPTCGKTLIWPAEWTHAHAGRPVLAGTKYIITGWMHFPHPSSTGKSGSSGVRPG